MLILTRKLGESITIGDDIRVSVLGIRGRQVRLGIEAPMKVVVHREEIYVRIQNENRKASNTVKGDIIGMVKKIKGKLTGDVNQASSGNVRYTDNSKDRKDQRDSGSV